MVDWTATLTILPVHDAHSVLLVAAAAGVRVTGLDLLQQRALDAQAGSVRDGAALPTPTSSWLPAGYQVVVDAPAPAAPGPRYASGLDILRARTDAVVPLGSRAPDTATRTGCCCCARERCLSPTTELFERREVGGWRAPFLHPLAPSSAFG